MSEQGHRAIVERYMRAIPSDLDTSAELHHPNFVQEFPQSDGKYPDGSAYKVVAILEFRDGKVRRATTCFAPPFEAPEWRKRRVEGSPT